MRVLFLVIILSSCLAGLVHGTSLQGESDLADRFRKLSRDTKWELVSSTRLQFRTHHPQGLAKVGERFFLSSVEVLVRPEPLVPPVDGMDRTTGKGIGHLYTFDTSGRLLNDLKLGEGSIYHPGGIDFDGKDLWVPVAEYRPHSQSIVYRINPLTMRTREMLRWKDHIGAVAFDNRSGMLTGSSWGSRDFIRIRVGPAGVVQPPVTTKNPSFFIDYQDCKQMGPARMLCSGISSYDVPGRKEKLVIGGMALVNTRLGITEYELPMELRTPNGTSMNRNPFWIETTATGLRLYFVPEDDDSTLYIYESKGL